MELGLCNCTFGGSPAISTFSLQARDPENYRLIFRSPANCAPSDCDIFVGIDTNTGNPDFLDIYMEGSAEGWVAVGFSDSPNMVTIIQILCDSVPVVTSFQ